MEKQADPGLNNGEQPAIAEENGRRRSTAPAQEEEVKRDSKVEPPPKGGSSKLSINDFDIIGVLGRGSYGEVALVRKKDGDKLFALKVIDKAFLSKEKKQYQVYVEKEVLTRLNHRSVVKMFYTFQDKQKLYFVIEYMEGGPFSEYLSVKRRLPVESIRFYSAEIVVILEYLHSNGIAHRDLKPNNLMLSDSGHLKVIDFGTAKFFDPKNGDKVLYERMSALHRNMDEDVIQDQRKHRSTFVGTAEYVSPELLEDSETGPASDLWALGCMLYQMYVGNLPFEGPNEYLIFQRIKERDINYPEDMPADLKSLIESLLIRNPDERLGAGEIGGDNDYSKLKAHPFFESVNFDAIYDSEAPMSQILSPFKKKKVANTFEAQLELGLANGEQTRLTTPQTSFHELPIILEPQIRKKGILLKKCGWIFYKPRMLVLYEPPKLLYYDPETNTLKGEVKLRKDMRIDYEGRERFSIVLPNRTYHFKEYNEPCNNWVDAIRAMKAKYFV